MWVAARARVLPAAAHQISSSSSPGLSAEKEALEKMVVVFFFFFKMGVFEI